MKLGIMQPYFLPYLGYFQLINAVDKFIIYDDVNFIKQGWINRNYFLLNNQKHLITVPLKQISSFKLIKDVQIDSSKYEKWFKKFIKTLTQVYQKAPLFTEIRQLIDSVYQNPKSYSISGLNFHAIDQICRYCGISTILNCSSALYANQHLSGQNRILDICQKEGASIYINAIGGHELYHRRTFLDHQIQLYFLQTNDLEYKQFNSKFVPSLSIIDVLMFNSIDDLKQLLNAYELI